MPIGRASQTASYAKPVAEAFADAEAVLRCIASVTDANTSDGSIRAEAKYGLQTVDFRVRILPADRGSTFEIASFSDDIWAAGARATIRNFLEALSRTGDTAYVPSANPINPTYFALVTGLFALALHFIIHYWESLPALVRIGIMVLGFSALAYTLLARWLFKRT